MKINNKRNNSIFSSLLGLQWAVNLLPRETCSLPEAETSSTPWTYGEKSLILIGSRTVA